MGLPQHASFKVAKIFDNNGGVTSPVASVDYGPTTTKPMLRFRDAIILFADKRLYAAYEKKVEPARPVNTSMKTIVLNAPLGDVLTKDDKQSYVEIKEGGITELIQIDGRLLTRENLNKSKQIIKAESNWKTEKIGKDEFKTRMLEGNDQMSTDIPKSGWNDLKDIANLLFSEKELKEGTLAKEFLKEYGNLQTYLVFQDTKVAGGLVSAGSVDGFFLIYGRRLSGVPQWLSGRPGVLVYSAAEGAKVDAEKTEQPAEKNEQSKIVIANTQEMKELVAKAKIELGKVYDLIERTANIVGAEPNKGSKWTSDIGNLISELEKQLGQ